MIRSASKLKRLNIKIRTSKNEEAHETSRKMDKQGRKNAVNIFQEVKYNLLMYSNNEGKELTIKFKCTDRRKLKNIGLY